MFSSPLHVAFGSLPVLFALELANISVQVQTVNILCFVGCLTIVGTIQLCHCKVIADTDLRETNGCGRVPVKLNLAKQAASCVWPTGYSLPTLVLKGLILKKKKQTLDFYLLGAFNLSFNGRSQTKLFYVDEHWN